MHIPYHNKADGFTAALVLALNQVRFCELNACYPVIRWGAFPACKYAGVRFPGRTPFFDREAGPNAFEYFFRPVCAGAAKPQQAAPQLTCEQREAVHRQQPWAVRTYYYGVDDPKPPPGSNETDTYDDEWYTRHRREGHRLVRTYLRLKPRLAAEFQRAEAQLLGGAEAQLLGGAEVQGLGAPVPPGAATIPEGAPPAAWEAPASERPADATPGGDGARGHFPPRRADVLGVHLRGTDKGKYLASAASGRPVPPREYEPYVDAFLRSHPNGTVFVATDSPAFLTEVKTRWLRRWPGAPFRWREDILRSEANTAFDRGAVRGAKPASNARKGEEVLIDALLLSRCDWLLHSASGVAEFAMYWNLRLHRRSVHLQYTRNRQHLPWMPR
jgi:hypothetical protein